MQNPLEPILTKMKKLTGLFKRKKLLLGATAIVAVALVGFYTLGGTKKAEGTYITDTVKKGAVTNTIPATGTVEPVNTVSLSFKNAEVIKKIYVKVGDHVTTGQPLAEQDGSNLELQLSQSSANLKGAEAKLELLKNGSTSEDIAQAEASLSMAQAAYNLAKTNLERNQKLFDGGAISQSDLDTTKNEYTSAEGKLKQAQESLKSLQNGNRPEDINAQAAQVQSSSAQLQMAQDEVAGTNMVSPMDGIVSAINGGEGQRATANNNSTSGGSSGFMVIISEALQVKAQVNEADIGKLEVGQKAEFTVNSFPDKTFTGKVSSISPQASTVSNVQVYDTVIQLDDNQQGLKAGMPANINMIINRRENTLTMAKGAVTYAASYLSKAGNEQKQQSSVLVLDKAGKPVPKQVVLGLSDQKNYEVLEGLNEGDTVVVGASSATSTGSAGSTSSKSTSKSSNNGSGGSPLMGGGPPPN